MIDRVAWRRWGRARAVLIAVSLTVAENGGAQVNRRQPPRVQPEARVDFIDARTQAAHAGVGFSVPAGTYVRLGAVAAAGHSWADSSNGFAGRVDALARFVVDPMRESRWAPYAAGGVGALFDDRDRWRAVLVATLGIEGPLTGGIVPALEIGLGGGARFGVAVRRAMPGRR